MTISSESLKGSGGTCYRGCCPCKCWIKFTTVFWNSVNILNCCYWFCSCTVTVSNMFFRLFSYILWSYSLWEISLYCWSFSSESWSIRSGCICWNTDPPSGPEGPGTGFFWGLDIVKTFDVVFACVIRVVRILYVEHGDFCGYSSYNVCCMLEAVRCGFYMWGAKIFAFYKRIRPKRTKIWWGTGVENFALESVCTASRTWIGYKQRFLPQVYSLTCCNTIQRLRLRAKRFVCSLTWYSTIVQLFEYGRRLNSIDWI